MGLLNGIGDGFFLGAGRWRYPFYAIASILEAPISFFDIRLVMLAWSTMIEPSIQLCKQPR